MLESAMELTKSTVLRTRGPQASCLVFSAPSRNSVVEQSQRATVDALRNERDISVTEMPFPESDALLLVADAVILIVAADALKLALRLIARIRSESPCCGVVLVGVEIAEPEMLSLLRAGVYDFVSAPFHACELIARVRRVLGLLRLESDEHAAHISTHINGLIGRSPAFTKLLAKLPVFANCDAGVLIKGETGTGKEVCARAIHQLSSRAAQPWVAVNCGAIPAELVESELFGHTRGAFTNAYDERPGLLREASGGTLFLDEIDCLPYGAQAKFLRFLQEKEYRPVGSSKLLHADVRIIAASNSNLPEVIARNQFRRDLYFRLNVLSVQLPPLRERCEDIPMLVQHFLHHFTRQFGRNVIGLAPLVMQRLIRYAWPGNVRELKHVMERAVLTAAGPMLISDDIDIEDMGAVTVINESFRDAKARVVENFERVYIEQLLVTCEGNVTQAAKVAQKNRRAFFELMRKYRITPERFRQPASRV